MNAQPILKRIAKAMHDCRLEAVMIGNAAAALQGASVTTLDFDFMFRKTRNNVEKIKRLADILNAVVMKPFYPASDLYRVVDDSTGLQLDFMSVVHGVRSFESLRKRAAAVRFGDNQLWVADLHDIIRSKAALGRPQDRAVLDILKETLREKERG